MSEKVNRRDFMSATGSVLGLGLGLGMTGQAALPSSPANPVGTLSLKESIRALVDKTPMVDTHEHLPPEADRVADLKKDNAMPADFGMLMSHYTDADLQVAGMSGEDYQKLVSRGLTPREKWKLVAPYYERCRHTGYQLCVREAVRALYGEDDLREDNCESLSQRIQDGVQPGFYRRILRDVANIEHAQVNCLKSPVFRQSEPATDLLSFDLWTVGIGSGVKRGTLNQCAGTEVTTLKQAHETIDRAFEKFGPKAIAVKDQSAYWRRLDFEDVSDGAAAPLFVRFAKEDPSLTPAERKALQDNLFRRCLRRATEQKLPVKLHTGYAAGHSSMDLARLRENLVDVTQLARDFPNTTFVLMHIAYPYQNELIALCKQYPRVYADMCWAWIIDPASAVRFLKEFLMAVPACKLFPFGGDFIPVELVPGHARVARRGISLALTQLVEDGWLAESDLPALVERLMRGNAHETYDLKRVLRA
jgi:hypothetical protein